MNIASLYAPVHLDESSVVGEHCTLGFPAEARIRAEQQQRGSRGAGKPVVVGPGCLVANRHQRQLPVCQLSVDVVVSSAPGIEGGARAAGGRSTQRSAYWLASVWSWLSSWMLMRFTSTSASSDRLELCAGAATRSDRRNDRRSRGGSDVSGVFDALTYASTPRLGAYRRLGGHRASGASPRGLRLCWTAKRRALRVLAAAMRTRATGPRQDTRRSRIDALAPPGRAGCRHDGRS